jgi:phosphosulfolactate synthase (CoM biosynthesis protein A)
VVPTTRPLEKEIWVVGQLTHYRNLEDILETMGEYVDPRKFAGGSFSLMPRPVLAELLKLCHDHDVLVSTGGFIEYVLTQGPEAVSKYIEECKHIGFDIVEISCGFITIPADDWLRLIERVQKAKSVQGTSRRRTNMKRRDVPARGITPTLRKS